MMEQSPPDFKTWSDMYYQKTIQSAYVRN